MPTKRCGQRRWRVADLASRTAVPPHLDTPHLDRQGTLLFFPSGAVYPVEGFPWWLRWISNVNPFTYTVHALRNLTLKSTGIEGIYKDVLVPAVFSAIMISACIALFKRQI